MSTYKLEIGRPGPPGNALNFYTDDTFDTGITGGYVSISGNGVFSFASYSWGNVDSAWGGHPVSAHVTENEDESESVVLTLSNGVTLYGDAYAGKDNFLYVFENLVDPNSVVPQLDPPTFDAVSIVPFRVQISNLSSTGALSYRVRYRPFDTEDFPLEDPNPEWTQENVIGTSIEVSSLRQGVWYEFQAQAVGDGETITDSDWSSSSEVYVIYSLGPIRIFLVTTTTGSVTIGGMRDQNGSGWLMNVSGAEGTVSPNSKGWVVVSGLSPSTLYEIKVKQLGVSGRNSDSSWSNILTVAPAESIRVYSHFLVTVEPIDDTSVIRKMELDNRVPMNGTEGQVLVWTENGPQWQTKNLVNGGSNNE